jgi:four helix bundle protein
VSALQAVERLRPLVEQIKGHDKSLADQIRRAASSVVLNLGEAAYNDAGNRRARLSTASGSANEARIGLKTAVAWGYIEWSSASDADEKLDAVLAKTWRWLHPKRS